MKHLFAILAALLLFPSTGESQLYVSSGIGILTGGDFERRDHGMVVDAAILGNMTPTMKLGLAAQFHRDRINSLPDWNALTISLDARADLMDTWIGPRVGYMLRRAEHEGLEASQNGLVLGVTGGAGSPGLVGIILHLHASYIILQDMRIESEKITNSDTAGFQIAMAVGFRIGRN